MLNRQLQPVRVVWADMGLKTNSRQSEGSGSCVAQNLSPCSFDDRGPSALLCQLAAIGCQQMVSPEAANPQHLPRLSSVLRTETAAIREGLRTVFAFYY